MMDRRPTARSEAARFLKASAPIASAIGRRPGPTLAQCERLSRAILDDPEMAGDLDVLEAWAVDVLAAQRRIIRGRLRTRGRISDEQYRLARRLLRAADALRRFVDGYLRYLGGGLDLHP